jgi:hypothetical protein
VLSDESKRRKLARDAAECLRLKADSDGGYYIPDLCHEIGLGTHGEDGGRGINARMRRRLYLDIKEDRWGLGFIFLGRSRCRITR